MSVRVVVGAQWGDEGKGKVVDLLGAQADYVVRYQGGANAGHTLKFDDTSIVLHLVPSGIFQENTHCVIGNGVVIDPISLQEEIEQLESMGVDLKKRLHISETAHVILPYHKTLDQVKEKRRGDKAIGTTGRGIGPAYVSKISRVGIRMIDLLDGEELEAKIRQNLADINESLEHVYHEPLIDPQDVIDAALDAANSLRPYICNTSNLLHEALNQNKPVLLEGAQGSLLDIDHGTYPYVTSSSPTSGGACTGSGIPPTAIQQVMGITKAYCTRVGNGPFPTELNDDAGEVLQDKGQEFGATTGRPRRCGWLDLVALKYAVRVNGINELALTKLDVLDVFDQIKVCTTYRINDQETETFPLNQKHLKQVQPIYQTFKGWEGSVRNIDRVDKLPEEARQYMTFIESYLNVKVSVLSTGPKRSETIIVDKSLL
ncbi:MAG: adenylosuccinate synthase [Bacteroidota bacterium]